MEFLLAACLMDEEERKAVRNVMELKYKSQIDKKENNSGQSAPGAMEHSTVSNKPTNNTKLTTETKSDVREVVPEVKPIDKNVSVKLELSDEIRVIPEEYDIPKQTVTETSDTNLTKPSFSCGMCDKTFLLKKQLTLHERKMNHFTPTPPLLNSNEFNCKLCKYVGSKERDLKAHVYRKHRSISTPSPVGNASPSPSPSPVQTAIPPGPNVQTTPIPKESNVVLSTLNRPNWSKTPKKTGNVKVEPEDNSKSNTSLEELPEARVEDESNPDDPSDVSMEEDTESTSSTIEDTTFVSIDSSSTSVTDSSATTNDSSVCDVDISKSKYFKANPQTVGQLLDKTKAEEQFSVLDDKMPEGWRVKEIVHEFKSGRKEKKKNYLTPDHKILKTGLAVLEYMRLSGKYTAKQIMDYAKYMAVPVNRLEKYMELYL